MYKLIYLILLQNQLNFNINIGYKFYINYMIACIIIYYSNNYLKLMFIFINSNLLFLASHIF